MTLLGFVGLLLAAEIGLVFTVRSLRRGFQWLITEADELPAFDQVALRKFLATSFDPSLGWIRRPNTTGREKGKKGEIIFHIDAAGARAGTAPHRAPTIAAFGDSYVFCRQVEDRDTWEEALARRTGAGVLNFGVGNYGADQGLLRYETTKLPSTVQVVILGFVPETICRIQSYWKHYLEFGNTFAFKPRFQLTQNGDLILHESAMRSEKDFSTLRTKLPQIQQLDGFYRRKFRSIQFRTPYLLSFARNPARHGRVIAALLLRRGARICGLTSPGIENRPFALIMHQNIADAHRLFSEPEATPLLRALLIRFSEQAGSRGHQPLVLLIPQLIDLRAAMPPAKSYQPFFQALAATMPVLDMTDALLAYELEDLYVEDQYGGHLSARGNQIVAEHIALWLTQYSTSASAQASMV